MCKYSDKVRYYQIFFVLFYDFPTKSLYFGTKYTIFGQNYSTMELRINDLLREQGLRISDLADKIGVDQSNLKKSLANNPKLSTLQEVAKALHVHVYELFTPNLPSSPSGVVVVNGRTYGMIETPTVVQIPSFDNFATLRKGVKGFVKNRVKEGKTGAFCALVCGYQLVSLVFDCSAKKFTLTLYYGDAESQTFFYDLMEFAEWKGGDDKEPVWNLDDVAGQITSDIENVVSFEFGDYTTPAEREVESE